MGRSGLASCSGWGTVRRLGRLLAVCCLSSFAGRAPGADPPIAASDDDLCVPVDPADWRVVRSGSPRAPSALAALAARTGVAWSAVWDDRLATPYLAFPEAPWRLPGLEAAPTGMQLADAALEFLQTHADLLGTEMGRNSLLSGMFRIKDGWLFSIPQPHGPYVVRGTAYRLRIDDDGSVRSLSVVAARGLPPFEEVYPEDYLGILPRDFGVRLDRFDAQIGFQPGTGTPVLVLACQPRGTIREGLEAFYAVRGRSVELISWREPRLYLDGPPPGCDGTIRVRSETFGYSPHPDAIWTVPAAYDPVADLHPVPVTAEVVIEAKCGGLRACSPARDGIVDDTYVRVEPDAPFTFRAAFGEFYGFRIVSGHEDYLGAPIEARGSVDFKKTFNATGNEYEAFHLLAFHHVQRAADLLGRVAERNGIDERYVPIGLYPLVDVRLGNDDFVHSFMPLSNTIFLSNDERVDVDDRGRPRKIVPTIVYHEYGHAFARRLSLGFSDPRVHEGVADAFAAILAGSSRVGHATRELPAADPHARDISLDEDVYPGDPRRAVAAALWDLWSRTLDPVPGTRPSSSFAESLMVRWLGARRDGSDLWNGGRSLLWHPFLGLELRVEADAAGLGGDGDPRNGFPHEDDLIAAFAGRGLYPLPFVRGDADRDGAINLTDAVAILEALFRGRWRDECLDASDANDDGRVNIADAVLVLGHLFVGAGPLPEPFEECGYDPTPHDGLGCRVGGCSPE